MITDPTDLLPPDWRYYGYTLEKSIDPTTLAIYIAIKERFPDAYVNAINGKRVYNWCGLRSPACLIGAKKSYHKLGKALDWHASQKRLIMLHEFCTSAEGLSIGIKRVENFDVTRTWLHTDTGEPNPEKWLDKTKPYIFNP